MSERTGLILSRAAGLDARLNFGDQVRLAAVAGEVCEGGASVRGEGAEETLELEKRGLVRGRTCVSWINSYCARRDVGKLSRGNSGQKSDCSISLHLC